MAYSEQPLQIARVIHALQNEHGWLFDRCDFHVAHTSLAGRYHTEPTVGLSNEKIQLLFNSEIALPLLASPGTLYFNRYDEDPKAEVYLGRYWQDSIMLFNYLDQLPHLYGRDKPGEFLGKITWKKLEERLPDLEQMFASEAVMLQWMPGFVQYLARFNGTVPPAKSAWLVDQ